MGGDYDSIIPPGKFHLEFTVHDTGGGHTSTSLEFLFFYFFFFAPLFKREALTRCVQAL